ncbi:hypothetical protein HYX70_00375 [Candidatus Saccharibacteria bacterium]|nr:hypothetical protein [Candidatus Saccharibacteria bacterium]
MKKPLPSGYITLMTVIVVTAIGSVVALLLLFSGVNTSKTSLSTQQSAQAMAAADGCAELALAAIQANIALPTPQNANFTIDTAAKSSCSSTITGTSPNYVINTTGTVDPAGKNVTRKLIVTLDRVGPTLNIHSWQEVP